MKQRRKYNLPKHLTQTSKQANKPFQEEEEEGMQTYRLINEKKEQNIFLRDEKKLSNQKKKQRREIKNGTEQNKKSKSKQNDNKDKVKDNKC